MEGLSFEEQVAASAVAALGSNQSKRNRDDSFADDGAGSKRGRTAQEAFVPTITSALVSPPPTPDSQEELRPFPWFYYRDFSHEEDPDSLTPLTPPGRVPNFPAKMHAILSRPDLADVICWMPHGRSWRVLKPREFEVRVIPTYFEHAKFSSFIRQANGWGFRRITQGRDRNTYYQPRFLRNLPHLCKKMKRPGVAEKIAADPDHEPDFYKIAETCPVPEKPNDESILLQCTLQGGPKARMPIYAGSYVATMGGGGNPAAIVTSDVQPSPGHFSTSFKASNLTPRDLSSLALFHQALGDSESQLKSLAVSPSTKPALPSPASLIANTGAPLHVHFGNIDRKVSPLVLANQLAAANPLPGGAAPAPSDMPAIAAAQFAAGFAAATALNQQQLRNVLGSFSFGSRMQPSGEQQQQPQAAASLGHSLRFLD